MSPNLDTTATIALFGAIAGIAGLAWVRLKPRHHSVDERAYGDVVEVPEGMRRAANLRPGGRAGNAARAHTHTDTLHSHVLPHGGIVP